MNVSYLKEGEGEDAVNDFVDIMDDLPISLQHEKRHRFCLECVIPATYRGSVNTWVVLVMEARLFHPDPLISNTSQMVVPLRLSGTVVNQSSIAELKADARAYIPEFVRKYFDKPPIPLSYPRPIDSMVPSFITDIINVHHDKIPRILSSQLLPALMEALKGSIEKARKDVPAVLDWIIESHTEVSGKPGKTFLVRTF